MIEMGKKIVQILRVHITREKRRRKKKRREIKRFFVWFFVPLVECICESVQYNSRLLCWLLDACWLISHLLHRYHIAMPSAIETEREREWEKDCVLMAFIHCMMGCTMVKTPNNSIECCNYVTLFFLLWYATNILYYSIICAVNVSDCNCKWRQLTASRVTV